MVEKWNDVFYELIIFLCISFFFFSVILIIFFIGFFIFFWKYLEFNLDFNNLVVSNLFIFDEF